MIMIFVKSVGGSIIRDITIKVADETDFEFIQGLVSLGMNRNVASLITYLKDQEERSSRDIEKAMGLRQPEVSTAMQTLRENDWIIERNVKLESKGRPMTFYALRSTTIDDIINYYEKKKTEEFAQTMEAIQRLKEFTSA
jgi:predicted transcriptional regulator